ncbi:MAG: rhamnulokinase [Bifidobacteriaceae bacterium]|jgi:rhamnulokinase|nr:rhamnulokinase [Bifidobacteriaceae bacterium]
MTAPSGPLRVAAIDLGASSGRVMVARLADGAVRLEEVHRFANGPHEQGDYLVWDVEGLFEQVVAGLRLAGPVASIGIDSWGVDYGLLDAAGGLLGPMVAYRDGRTERSVPAVLEGLGAGELYGVTGIQHQPFNTIFQLKAEAMGLAPGGARLPQAARALLLPDLLAYWLTGQQVTETTNASTTALLDARTGTWSASALAAAGVERDLFAPLVKPGHVIGHLLPQMAEATGLPEATPVVAVGSHDTASAVAAVPSLGGGGVYVSCGTWSLAGVELAAPVLTEAARAANFTNERGVGGTIRFLRNVMGLWLLSESQRQWREEGRDVALGPLLAAAAAEPAGLALVDADAAEFLAPGNMPARLAAAVARAGGRAPQTPAQVARLVIDSLAASYAKAAADAERLTGRPQPALHLVGGGSQGELLCQATADAAGRPVLAGPAEASALGNALVQAQTLGAVGPGLDELRAVVAASFPVKTYLPNC